MEVIDAAVLGYGLYLQIAVSKQVLCRFDPLCFYKLRQCTAGLPFERGGEIFGADLAAFGKALQTQVAQKIALDLQNSLFDHRGVILCSVLLYELTVGFGDLRHELLRHGNGVQAFDAPCEFGGEGVDINRVHAAVFHSLSKERVHDDAVVFDAPKLIRNTHLERQDRNICHHLLGFSEVSVLHGGDQLVFEPIAHLERVDRVRIRRLCG